MRKPEPNKARAATATKAAECMPKKVAHKGSSGKKEHPRWTVLSEIAGEQYARQTLTTYNTRVCHRVSNDSSLMDKPTKYFDSTRKPCKKTGSGDPSQMVYLTEKLTT